MCHEEGRRARINERQRTEAKLMSAKMTRVTVCTDDARTSVCKHGPEASDAAAFNTVKQLEPDAANLASVPLHGAATWRIKYREPLSVYFESSTTIDVTIPVVLLTL